MFLPVLTLYIIFVLGSVCRLKLLTQRNHLFLSGFQQTPLAVAVPSSVASSLAAAASFVLLVAVASASPIAAPRGESELHFLLFFFFTWLFFCAAEKFPLYLPFLLFVFIVC